VTVGDVMSRAPVTLGPALSLYEALVLLRSHDITGAPVVDDERNVIGVLSQKDLARRLAVPVDLPDVKGLLDVLMVGLGDQRVEALAKLEQALQNSTVESTMSRPPFVVRSDAPLELAMQVMAENAISRLPVVTGHRLVGIVTPTDLISAALRSPRKAA
jgi:CBS domain-containing protein